jgi:uncharacterized protein (TIGR02646 family)
MKRIKRTVLPKVAQQYLDKRQQAVNLKQEKNILDTTADWKAARQTKSMSKVLAALHAMIGQRQRCMYCLDSHGSDIEHFRPKAIYANCMYKWDNLLLCCTHCGRLKGNMFPLSGSSALLVDPTKENPWDYLDFDHETGNICARFDVQLNTWSVKGEKTVEVLHLDKREALSAGYLQTLGRLSKTIVEAISDGNSGVDAGKLTQNLKSNDDHGLLGWCFSDRTSTLKPFSELRQQHPSVWVQCVSEFTA